MTKTLVAAQKRRGKKIKKKLQAIDAKIQAVLLEFDDKHYLTPDAENLIHNLVQAQFNIKGAVEFYCKYL